MDINEMTTALNEKYEGRFGEDYAGHFDISLSEAERIAEQAESADEFISTWEAADWWKDQ